MLPTDVLEQQAQAPKLEFTELAAVHPGMSEEEYRAVGRRITARVIQEDRQILEALADN